MISDESYRTIASPSEGSYRDRGSKFVAEAFPLANEGEAKKISAQIKKKHPKANHHCYAWRLTPDKTIYKFSDDREPSGSAGRPILNVLLSNELTDIVIIVSRYFGGALLGVRGLINAYRTAAQNAIDNAALIQKTINEKYELQFEYSLLNEVLNILRIEKVLIIEKKINELCKLKFEVRKSKSEFLLEKIKNNPHLIKNIIILPVK